MCISLVRSVLEFSLVLWSHSQISFIESLDHVQRQLLCLITYKRQQNFDLNTSLHTSLLSVQACFKLEFLVSRRKCNDIYFTSKRVNGLISWPKIIQLLNFHVSQYLSRKHPTFLIPMNRSFTVIIITFVVLLVNVMNWRILIYLTQERCIPRAYLLKRLIYT